MSLTKPGDNYVAVYVGGVFMGWFCGDNNHVMHSGLEYSIDRIWDNNITLIQVRGDKYYYE